MKLNNYNKFSNKLLLKNLISELLTEAKVMYMNDFRDILKSMKSPVAKQMLDLSGKDLKITTNFLRNSSNTDKILFYPPETNFKYMILNNNNDHRYLTSLFRIVGLPRNTYHVPPPGTIGEIKKIYTNADLRDIPLGMEIAHFVYGKDENAFLGVEGLTLAPNEIKPQEGNIGRIAKRMLQVGGVKILDKDLENFVNEFKSKISSINERSKLFEIVSGDDITHWYNEKYYDNTKSATLQNSCMRYSKCSEYFGIYAENPEVCKLLILKSPNNSDLIIGRALVWTLNDGDTFMDRIYYSYESDVLLFKDYANKNKWCYKLVQNSDPNGTIQFEDKNKEGRITVTLKNHWFDDYPYLDTLKFLNESEKTLSNDDKSFDLELSTTSGGRGECGSCGGEGRVNCGECDGDGSFDCPSCSGSGTEDCDICRGRGHHNCPECDGSGKISDDDGDEKDCSECDGSGKIDCDDCGSNGEINCHRCDGERNIECNNCYGNGNVDCREC